MSSTVAGRFGEKPKCPLPTASLVEGRSTKRRSRFSQGVITTREHVVATSRPARAQSRGGPGPDVDTWALRRGPAGYRGITPTGARVGRWDTEGRPPRVVTREPRGPVEGWRDTRAESARVLTWAGGRHDDGHWDTEGRSPRVVTREPRGPVEGWRDTRAESARVLTWAGGRHDDGHWDTEALPPQGHTRVSGIPRGDSLGS